MEAAPVSDRCDSGKRVHSDFRDCLRPNARVPVFSCRTARVAYPVWLRKSLPPGASRGSDRGRNFLLPCLRFVRTGRGVRACNGQPLRRAVPGAGAGDERGAGCHDKEPFRPPYPARRDFGDAHCNVLSAGSAGRDRTCARGHENPGRRESSPPPHFLPRFSDPACDRLVDISDTLALSIETRGFTLGKAKYTVYKKEWIRISDILFAAGLAAGAVLVVLW